MLLMAAAVTAISYGIPLKYLFCLTENLSCLALYAWLAALKLNAECEIIK